jgi:hypothetical protein
MGLSPAEVDRLSMWQFMAACRGFAEAHDPDSGKQLSDAEADDVWEWLNRS